MIFSLTKLFEKYERHISSLALLFGFIFDNLTLTRIDQSRDHIILASYLLIALVGIVLVNLSEAGKLKWKEQDEFHPWLLFAIQFAFGGAFSSFFILYSRSSSYLASWPFLAVLFLLLVGNEFFKKQYARLAFQMSIFFVALFSFAIFFVPVILHEMGDRIFLFSGFLSLLLVSGILFLLSKYIPVRVRGSRNALLWGIGSIFVLVNILYFTNIIPPIPLSLKDIGVFHFVGQNKGGGFSVVSEEKAKNIFFSPREIIHVRKNDPVYVFSAVFAPTALETKIVHEWEYYDEEKGWVPNAKVPFRISGGRDGGYRGYSLKQNIFPGIWRVNVETERGQTIGRMEFEVQDVEIIPKLETATR